MKKIALFLLIAVPAFSLMAQDQAATTISKEYQVENQTAHDLYLRAFAWVNDFFNNPANELSDLKFKPSEFSLQGSNQLPSMNGRLNFSMKWTFTAGKATLVISNLSTNNKSIQDYFGQITSRLDAALKVDLPENEKAALENQIKAK